MVDRLQRRRALRNALRWLMVSKLKERLTSIEEFYELDVERYGVDNATEFQALAEEINKIWKILGQCHR